jgi:predicted molibdopterin-dependent oxidoreductase YjgC
MKIFVNSKEIKVLQGEMLIEVARRAGFTIPALCYAKDARHRPSCMICVVMESRSGRIIPSCTALPEEGMRIETDSLEVRLSRTLSLELLLSDHRADCEAPCRIACPGNMDIAAMNRLYDEGKNTEALTLLRDTLVIPATLCFICSAPCEKVCRKGDISEPVQVREIKKNLVAQTDLNMVAPPAVRNGKKIAVNGSSPAALAAAYHLNRLGYAVTLFEPLGQMLAPYIRSESVPVDILELEMEVIKRMGIELRYTSEPPSPDAFDGIVPQTKPKQPARMILEGRRLAEDIHALLSSGSLPQDSAMKAFNSAFSRFTGAEKKRLNKPSSSKTDCLYCDCNGKTSCRLRRYATQYGIGRIRYTKDGTGEALRRLITGKNIMFEPAKCIKCGLCVYNTDNGFTFDGRGFLMQVTLPEENESNVNEQITELCPTAALYCI